MTFFCRITVRGSKYYLEEKLKKFALHILDNFYTFSGSEKTRTFEVRRRTLLISRLFDPRCRIYVSIP